MSEMPRRRVSAEKWSADEVRSAAETAAARILGGVGFVVERVNPEETEFETFTGRTADFVGVRSGVVDTSRVGTVAYRINPRGDVDARFELRENNREVYAGGNHDLHVGQLEHNGRLLIAKVDGEISDSL